MLVPIVSKDGQPFVDEYASPNEAGNVYEIKPNPVAAAFGAKPVEVSFNRVLLRWMKPDGKGGVVPRT